MKCECTSILLGSGLAMLIDPVVNVVRVKTEKIHRSMMAYKRMVCLALEHHSLYRSSHDLLMLSTKFNRVYTPQATGPCMLCMRSRVTAFRPGKSGTPPRTCPGIHARVWFTIGKILHREWLMVVLDFTRSI